MILDTNALSAWRDGDVSLLQMMGPPGSLLLPVIAVGEYRFGLVRSTQRPRSEAWLDQIIRTVRIAPITVETTTSYALVRSMLQRKGLPMPANDAWIAALGLQHRLPVLSRDKHFDVVDGLTRVPY